MTSNYEQDAKRWLRHGFKTVRTPIRRSMICPFRCQQDMCCHPTAKRKSLLSSSSIGTSKCAERRISNRLNCPSACHAGMQGHQIICVQGDEGRDPFMLRNSKPPPSPGCKTRGRSFLFVRTNCESKAHSCFLPAWGLDSAQTQALQGLQHGFCCDGRYVLLRTRPNRRKKVWVYIHL